MSLKGKSVLVTGGAGFIGSHLVDRLVREKPERIDVVDNLFLGRTENLVEARANFSSIALHRANAADEAVMRRIMESAGTDVVFNLAIVPLPTSLEKPAWTFRENNEITLTMCELQRADLFDTLVHFSSSEVYGSAEHVPMGEKHPLNPCTPYAASKAADDHLVMSYVETFGMDSSIIRPFNNYGPRQNDASYAGVIPATIKRIMRGESPVIYGDGRQTRDYIYVTDTADAAVKIYNTKKTRGRVLNIASGKEVTVNQLIRIIAGELGWKKPAKHGKERPGDVRRHLADINLARRLIGFRPKVGFEDGIRKTVGWYLDGMAK